MILDTPSCTINVTLSYTYSYKKINDNILASTNVAIVTLPTIAMKYVKLKISGTTMRNVNLVKKLMLTIGMFQQE